MYKKNKKPNFTQVDSPHAAHGSELRNLVSANPFFFINNKLGVDLDPRGLGS